MIAVLVTVSLSIQTFRLIPKMKPTWETVLASAKFDGSAQYRAPATAYVSTEQFISELSKSLVTANDRSSNPATKR